MDEEKKEDGTCACGSGEKAENCCGSEGEKKECKCEGEDCKCGPKEE